MRSTTTNALSDEAPAPQLRRRRILYGVVNFLIVSVLGLAVLDGIDLVDTVGVDVRTVSADGPDGLGLAVEYTAVTRPALAGPLRIHVTGLREGQRVRVGIERDYLAAWDHNAAFPAPDAEVSSEPWVIWEYDASGPELVIEVDARLEPGEQTSRSGRVAILDDSAVTVAQVAFTTHVRP
jgi:hypothetical protein